MHKPWILWNWDLTSTEARCWLSGTLHCMKTRAMRKLWLSVSVEDSQHMIDMLDTNHDNRVSMDEFRRFVYLLPESLVSFRAW